MSSITVDALRKQYGDTVAVDGISFAAEPGQVFGLLGPNGAGKTTTISVLCTLLRPTEGRALVNDRDVTRQADAVRRSIGLIFQDPSLDVQLTARENLDFHAFVYDVPSRESRARGRRSRERPGQEAGWRGDATLIHEHSPRPRPRRRFVVPVSRISRAAALHQLAR